MQDKIIIKGAREHNLKNINLELPRNKMIVFTGLSGSGKSSLAFDTIFAEGQRRYVESLSAYARQFLGNMQKPDVDEIEGLSPGISIDQKAHSANPRSTVATITEVYDYLRVLFARVGKPFCPQCGQKIEKMTTDEIAQRILASIPITPPAPTLSESPSPIRGGTRHTEYLTILAPVVRGRKGEYYQMLYDLYNSGFSEVRVDGKIKSLRERITLERHKKHTIEVVVDRLDGEDKQQLAEAIETAVDLSDGLCTVISCNPTRPDTRSARSESTSPTSGGTRCGEEQECTYSTKYSCPRDGFSFPEIEPRLFSFNSPYGYCSACTGLGTKELFSEAECPVCLGKRLNENALSVRIAGKSIWDVVSLTIGQAQIFFEQAESELSPTQREIAGPALREVRNRLRFMADVGLHYITLARTAGTLSGGEAQRIRLASQVGQRLVGALYVLDEPTIGLHQRDNALLVRTLRDLCDIGNTIIVVEHDEDTILTSDWVVDIGPGAGTHGGEIVFSGPLERLLKGDPKSRSLTGRYLRGEKKIEAPKARRKVDSHTPKIKVRGASEHNLKNIDVEIPLRRFVALTGVSGSGKSTLMNGVVYRAIANKLNHTRKRTGAYKEIKGLEYIDAIIRIDQSPIGRTPRSNPATYTKAYDHIRDLFAQTPEARIRGYAKGRFSFNRPGGRCENCEGKGVLDIEMHFLPSVQIVCDVCRGARFNNETLQVHYDGKNISDILRMTIEEAEAFFKDIPAVYDKLKMLNSVGLDYLTLGQSATTLSGGEAQRIKLSKELSKRYSTKTLYLLDEPTTGLHYDDVRKLVDVLQSLVSKGNTVMVIEHNLDVIKCADWIIDLGPEGGDEGGHVVKVGTPEEVARYKPSYTGQYLGRLLK